MAEASNTVVPKIEPQTEDQFHAAMMVAISGLIKKYDAATVAERLGFNSKRQIGNLANGSFPAVWRLFNLLSLDSDALDAIDREYGTRRVPRDAICSSDPVSAKLAALLSRTIEIEHPSSDGGQDTTLNELLMLDEQILRESALKLNGWIERIDAYRAGEKPRVRAVG